MITTTTTVVCCIISVLLPLQLFSFVHRRNSVDVYAAVPVKRSHQMNTIILFTFICSFGIYLIGWLITPAISPNFLSISEMLKNLTVTALLLLTIQLFVGAGYLIGNNTFDALVILAAYTFFIPALALATDSVTATVTPYDLHFSDDIIRISPLYLFYKAISGFKDKVGDAVTFSYVIPTSVFIVFAVSILIYYVLVRRNFVFRKMERAEQVSDNILGYRLIIPLYAFIVLENILASLKTESMSMIAILVVLTFVAYSVGHFIYRRTVRPSKRMIGGFLLITLLAAGFTAAAWTTHGFGRGDRMFIPDKNGVTTYDYSVESDPQFKDNITVEFKLFIDEKARVVGNEPFQESKGKKLSDRDYRRLQKILTDYQTSIIENFYTKFYDKDYSSRVGYTNFDITSRSNGKKRRREYSFPDNRTTLSVKDIKFIGRFIDITVLNDESAKPVPFAKAVK